MPNRNRIANAIAERQSADSHPMTAENMQISATKPDNWKKTLIGN